MLNAVMSSTSTSWYISSSYFFPVSGRWFGDARIKKGRALGAPQIAHSRLSGRRVDTEAVERATVVGDAGYAHTAAFCRKALNRRD